MKETLNVGRTIQWTGDHMDTKWKERKLASMHNSVPSKQECPWASLQLLLSFKTDSHCGTGERQLWIGAAIGALCAEASGF